MYVRIKALKFIKRLSLEGLCFLVLVIFVIDRFNNPHQYRLRDYLIITVGWLARPVILHGIAWFREQPKDERYLFLAGILGIVLATLFFVSLSKERHFGVWSEVTLFACFLWGPIFLRGKRK